MSENPSSRSERIAVAAVTLAAGLIGGFFLWTALTSPAVEGGSSARGPVVFVVANAVVGVLLW